MVHSTLTGSSAGSFWHRLGLIEAQCLDALALQGAAATTNVLVAGSTPTRIGTVQADFAAGTADYDAAQAYQKAADDFQASPQSFLSTVQQVVQGDLVYLANKDAAQPVLTVPQAVSYLIACMTADAATINQGTLPAAGAQASAVGVTPVGNPTFFFSMKDAAGRALQYVYPETLQATITQDSQTGAAKGSEPYALAGQNAQSSPLAWDWLLSGKYGSGASAQGGLVDPTVSNTSGTGGANLLVNGTFTAFAATDQADNWTYAVGVATTNFLNGTGNAYYGGQGSLKMLSAGGTKNAVTQAFATASSTGVGAGGTPYVLVCSAANNTQYGVWVAVKMASGSPANGTLTVDLITGDGTVGGSTTVSDDQSTANTFAIDLTALADTNWHVFTGAFRLPKALAAGPYKLRLAFTGTVLTAANAAYVNVALAALQQLYPGGPAFAGVRGSTDVNASGTAPDSWTFAVTATIGKLQKAMWRWFNVPGLAGQVAPAQPAGVVIPAVSSGSATVADSLVA